MIIDKERYFIEVKKLSETRNLKTEDFEQLYDIYINNYEVTNSYKNMLCDKVINDLFNTMGETWLPYKFIDTEIGKVIFSLKLSIDNKNDTITYIQKEEKIITPAD